MRRSSLSLIVVALTLSCAHGAESTSPDTSAAAMQSEAETTAALKGRVVGHDGQPVQAHARVFAPGKSRGDFLGEIQVADDGSFELRTDYTGYASLEFTGVDHAQLRVGVLLEPGTHELEVKLGTYARPKDYEGIRVSGKRGKDGKAHKADLKRQDDGTWTAEIQLEPVAEKKPEKAKGSAADDPNMDPARKARIEKMKAYRESLNAFADDEFSYQLSNVAIGGRTMNGTQSERFSYDGGGDYHSVTKIEADKVTITFDPKALPPSGADPTITWGDPESALAQVGRISLENTKIRAEVDAYIAENLGGDADAEAREKVVTQAGKRQRAALGALIQSEHGELARKALLVAYTANYTEVADEDDAQGIYDQALTTLDALDPLWAMSSGSMGLAIKRSSEPEKWTAYADKAIEAHPTPNVSASLLAGKISRAEEDRDMDAARAYFAKLQDKRFADTGAARWSKQLDPDRPTAPGKTVPNFSVASLDDPKVMITQDTMRGQAYILDFWATWCKPCIAEMPDLHGAYADANGMKRPKKGRKYKSAKKGAKLQVLSVSFDDDPADAKKFHKKEWPMPWKHARTDSAKREELTNSFAIPGIPSMLLIDENGTIIATTGELRGTEIHKTIERYFTGAKKEEATPEKPKAKDASSAPVAAR